MTTKSAGEAKTMAELLARAGKKVQNFTVGQRVKAKLISKNSTSVIFDVGGKSEGIVKEKGYTDAKEFIETLKAGDEVMVTVLVPETRDGLTILALKDAMNDITWEKANDALKKDQEVVVLGKGVGTSGFLVNYEGLEGFIPMSQIGKAVSSDLENMVGKYFKAKIIEVDRTQNKIVLSEKEVSEAGDIKLAKEAEKSVKEGEIYDGVVTTVAGFGVFVKFDVPVKKEKAHLEGLVHVSEISYKKVAVPSDVLKIGDKVKVRVLASRDGKLALSIKQAEENPWTKAEGKYKVEAKVKGKVSKISDFGVFVELEPGVEGLIHITKIPPTKKYEVGHEVDCIIEEVNIKDKRISLSPVLTSIPLGYK